MKDVNIKTGDHLSQLYVNLNIFFLNKDSHRHFYISIIKTIIVFCLSQNVLVAEKFPILQIVLFNFPVLQSLTLVKLFSCKSPNPLNPCSNIHPHPSLREWLVQPKRNGGHEHGALDEVHVMCSPHPHHKPPCRLITYWVFFQFKKSTELKDEEEKVT